VEGGVTTGLDRLVDAARFGTYFDCLGIPPDATTTEVHEAFRRRTAEAEVAGFEVAADGERAAALAEARQVIRDAFDVLSDPDLRLCYRRSLGV
jgi:curved DNA-binding protein CbpA